MNDKIKALFAKAGASVEVARHHLKMGDERAYGFMLSHISYKDPMIPLTEIDKELRGVDMTDDQLIAAWSCRKDLNILERWQLESALSKRII